MGMLRAFTFPLPEHSLCRLRLSTAGLFSLYLKNAFRDETAGIKSNHFPRKKCLYH